MHMKERFAIRANLACLAAFAVSNAALACTGAYVGRAVSEDGAVLLCRTVDLTPWTTCHRLNATPRVENSPGRAYKGVKGCSWDLPATTWKFVSTPMLSSMKRGDFDSACVNEKGLAITGTVTGRNAGWVAKADPYVKTGFGEYSMPGLLARCCTTAREAVELLGRVVARQGHNGPEIYMFADKDEAWYVEVYSGHQWAAVKMPEDKVAVFGNQFMINAFDPSSSDSLHSSELLSLAERNGKLVRDANGLVNLCATYGAPLADYSNYRTWYGHRAFAPATAGEYATSREMPLFFTPARKIGRRDVFELFRSRYEDVDRCPEAPNGDGAARVIGTTKQATCHVIALDPRLPETLRGTIWFTLANAEHSVFLPANASANSFAAGYADDQSGDFRYDPRLAGMAFRRLCALSELDRHNFGSGVRSFWRDREGELLAGYATALATRDATRIEAFCNAAQETALVDARRIFDELTWYVMENNRIPGDDGRADKIKHAPPFQPHAACLR